MHWTASRIWLTLFMSLLVGCASDAAPSPPASPTEQQVIAFHSDPGGRDDFYLVNADGTDVRQITDGAETVAFPYWSPDGTRVAYLCCTGGEASVWVMDADGSNPLQLTEAPSGEPAWSPDGTQLAYVSYQDESIWVVSADGSGRQSLEQQGGGPAWSPDGQRIAFFSRRDFPGQDQRNELYLAEADGTGVVRLTNDEVEDILPVWSPDGSRLAWIRSVDRIPHVFVMEADGTDMQQLTGGPDPDDAAQWSPDGSRILFVRYLDGADPLMLGQGNAEIFTVVPDVGVEVNLTQNDGWDGYPAWSPDGSQIAFGRNEGAQFNLMVMNADGSGVRELPGAPDATVANDCCPAWRP
jgi:tol-pal system beta propeller repeat protein TolB